MGKVRVVKIQAKYVRPKPNDVAVYDLAVVESQVAHEVMDKCIVCIRSQGFGGNHYHERVESWIAMGGTLELIWIQDSKKMSMIMNPKESSDMQLITIDSNVPHLIRNISDKDAYLVEYADQSQTDAVPFDVINYVYKNE